MVDPNNGWLGVGIQSAVATLVVAAVVMGCASSQAPYGSEAGSMVQTIGDVSVARDGDDSIIRLTGLVDPIYSVTTPDDQNLVVVDLVGVGKAGAESLAGAVGDEAEQKAEQIAAYDGVIDLVTLSTFDEDGGTPLTRVEIVMASAGQAEVFSTGDGLEIRVSPGAAGISEPKISQTWDDETRAEELSAVEPWQAVEVSSSELAMDAQPMDAMPMDATPMVAVEPPPSATKLTGVSSKVTDGGVLVAIEADGGIGAVEAFTLENPARLVIDLPGLVAGSAAGNNRVDSTFVTGVRVAGHADRVRVVVDGGVDAGAFQGRQIMPGARGLWVSIGDGAALSQAMNEALAASESAWVASATPVPVLDSSVGGEAAVFSMSPETTPMNTEMLDEDSMFETLTAVDDAASEVAVVEVVEVMQDALGVSMDSFELAEVYGLHYERTEGLDRTAILADEAVSYTLSSPDATTVVVSILNARISAAASDRIFPKAGGPISLIHAFQQPEVVVPEVRVVFTRAPNQAPVVSRRGSMLFVDFADMGVAAAAPPAFPNAGSTADPMSTPSMGAAATAATPPSLSELTQMSAEESLAASTPVPVAVETMSPAALAVAKMNEAAGLPSFESGAGMAPALSGGVPASMWDAPVAAAAAPAAVEVPAAIEVLEEGGLIDGKEYRGRRVSLDFKDVAIADVLRLIAEVSDLNIIAGDEVSGNVTIRLVEVPWDQALDVILMTKGLGFVRVGNVLRIAPSDVLKAEEEVRLQERRNKEKLEDLEVKLLPVNYAAVKDTEGLVKRLLSARGTVNIDARTNTLIIKDISSVIDEASALIAAIDTQTPQVMIEAKIVEANLDFTRELGSVWGVQTQQFTDPFDPDTQRQDLGSEDLTFIDDNSLAFGNPITAVPTGLMTLGALILDQDFRVDVQVQAAESTGDGKVVSSPRIVTLDNKEARIEQGVSIPFQTFEGGDAKLEFIDAVLSLIVTPHITADESIIMEIEVTRNAPDGTVPTPTGSPAISKNVAETETLVKDGQTLVLGGIYTITKSKTQSRVPYLHRIPVIGNAFKNNSVVDSRKELLVFVTPRIVRLPEMAGN